MSFFDNPEVLFAIHAVESGAILARSIQKVIGASPIEKSDHTPVTVADFSVQAVIASFLEKEFPKELLVAEEDAASLKQEASKDVLREVVRFVAQVTKCSEEETVCRWIDRGKSKPAKRFWTLDPIDGTKGFLRGDHYVVALALISDGDVLVGALGCPTLSLDGNCPDAGSIILGVKGKGAWSRALGSAHEWQKLQVSSRTDFKEAILVRSFEGKHTDPSKTNQAMTLLGIKKQPLHMDSLAKYVMLASGKADIYARIPAKQHAAYKENIWDQAAGALVIQEAGGRVTDLDGKSLDFSCGRKLEKNRGILATNGQFYTAVFEAFQKIKV